MKQNSTYAYAYAYVYAYAYAYITLPTTTTYPTTQLFKHLRLYSPTDNIYLPYPTISQTQWYKPH